MFSLLIIYMNGMFECLFRHFYICIYIYIESIMFSSSFCYMNGYVLVFFIVYLYEWNQ